ncbi:MAG: hypothetical protein IH845_04415 [Nanoarchaeota archaeon]|nr:hypothetical protein [Nanoarchaeota archaeon]
MEDVDGKDSVKKTVKVFSPKKNIIKNKIVPSKVNIKSTVKLEKAPNSNPSDKLTSSKTHGKKLAVIIIILAMTLLLYVPTVINDAFINIEYFEEGDKVENVETFETFDQVEEVDECVDELNNSMITKACRGFGGINVVIEGKDSADNALETAMFFINGEQFGEYSIGSDGFVSIPMSEELMNNSNTISFSAYKSSGEICDMSSSFVLVDC